MDQSTPKLQHHLPALRWAVPHLVEFAKRSSEYPLGMGARYLDLAVVQAIHDVLGDYAAEPRLKGYWIGGYWPSFKSDPPDKMAQQEFEFGHRTVCHVGEHVISSDGVEVWEEFRARLFKTAASLCAKRGMNVAADQFILVDMHVGSFSLSSPGTDIAAMRLDWLLSCYNANEAARVLSLETTNGISQGAARRL